MRLIPVDSHTIDDYCSEDYTERFRMINGEKEKYYEKKEHLKSGLIYCTTTELSLPDSKNSIKLYIL